MQGAHFHPFITERYRSDRQFQLEIDYCAEQGIRHSEFLEWDEDDQAKAIVWLEEKNLKCPDCGTRREESDPKLGGTLHAYHVERFTCYVCKNIEDEYDDERKSTSGKKGKIRAGFKVRVIPDFMYQERRRLRKQMAAREVRKKALKSQVDRQAFMERINSGSSK